MAKTAILVDGGFYRKRAYYLWGSHSPEETAKALFDYCIRHLRQGSKTHPQYNDLYRIFYYDCYPATKKVFHPYLKRTIDLSKTPDCAWMTTFIQQLTQTRKVALRMGTLDEQNCCYTLRPDVVKSLFTGKKTIDEVTEADFMLSIRQKGVDMKLGVDIASLAYKRQVDQIILIAGDSDFVPAAKLARREGIDLVLDPLGAPIKSDLFEHIDGKSNCGNPYNYKKKAAKSVEDTVSE